MQVNVKLINGDSVKKVYIYHQYQNVTTCVNG